MSVFVWNPSLRKKTEEYGYILTFFQENSLPFIEMLQSDRPSDTSVEAKDYSFFISVATLQNISVCSKMLLKFVGDSLPKTTSINSKLL